jgi:hypothetical protein
LLKIIKDIEKTTGLTNQDACDLLIDVSRSQNPRASLHDNLFSDWSDDDMLAHILKYSRQYNKRGFPLRTLVQ